MNLALYEYVRVGVVLLRTIIPMIEMNEDQ